MTTAAQHQAEMDVILKRAEALVQLAQGFGLVLTISTKPRQPLCMGHYDSVIELRADNKTYRGES